MQTKISPPVNQSETSRKAKKEKKIRSKLVKKNKKDEKDKTVAPLQLGLKSLRSQKAKKRSNVTDLENMFLRLPIITVIKVL